MQLKRHSFLAIYYDNFNLFDTCVRTEVVSFKNKLLPWSYQKRKTVLTTARTGDILSFSMSFSYFASHLLTNVKVIFKRISLLEVQQTRSVCVSKIKNNDAMLTLSTWRPHILNIEHHTSTHSFWFYLLNR